MKLKDQIVRDVPQLTEWRRDFHAHPELAFEEHRTSDLVAQRLEAFGVEVHRGLAETGVVGRLKAGTGNRAIALRADMDALPMDEHNEFDHRSQHEGRMHACGHDGHTTMLLGAAKYLAETKGFDGTVYFIFQPAEEAEGGADRMVADGLFEKFPVEAVYGLHNWPGMPAGRFGVAAGPMMAAFDIFDLVVRGRGSHAAMPHQGVDPIVAAAQIVTALQTISSRSTNPLDAVVLSVTQIHAGDAYNIIPDAVTLKGTVRSFKDEVRDSVEPAMRRIAGGICEALGAEMELHYDKRYPATVNSEDEAELAAAAAVAVAGTGNVERRPSPSMGSEDFAYMLRERPGCYAWLGNGPMDGGCMLHNPNYDFNDDILPVGASYWATLVEHILSEER